MAEIKKTDSMSEGLKAEINKQRKEMKQKGIGEYTENAGGGTPGTGGRGGMHTDGSSTPGTRDFLVFDSPDDRLAQEAKDQGIKVRYNQPRDDNGQFTYNSANAKGLSTKTSRGYTDPPFLAGVDLTFIKKGNVLKYKNENNETRRVISTIDMTEKELVNACKVYFKTKGGFLGVIGTGITKKGRQTKQEEQVETGLAGQTDLSTKSQATQQEAQQAAQNKGTNSLAQQAHESALSEQEHTGLVGFQKGTKGEVVQPRQTKPSTPAPAPAGAGAGSNKTNASNTQATQQTNKVQQPSQNSQPAPQQPQQKNNQVNFSALGNSAQNMLNQYLASKKGDSTKVNQGVSSQGKQNLMSKWLKKKQQ